MVRLAEEIIEEILLRLPVKSLLRFRCVCKAWCTLISQPQFTRAHLCRQRTHPITQILVPPSVDSQPNDGFSVDLEFPLGLSSSKGSTAILDSCHGLLCLVDGFYGFHIHQPPHELVLWNPSTRQSNHLPFPSFVNYSSCLYGFGYDSYSDDYKIVRVFSLSATHRTGIDVFSLKTNNWRRVQATHSSVIEYELATFFKGSVHWLARRPNGAGKRCVIVAFSFREEKVQEMELPSKSVFFGLRVLGECLCVAGLCSYDLDSDEMWVMEEYGKKESWKRLITFPYGTGDDSNGHFPRVLRFLENGPLLVVHAEKLVLCDPKENTWKNITTYKWTKFLQLDVALYVETLVSPYGKNGTVITVPNTLEISKNEMKGTRREVETNGTLMSLPNRRGINEQEERETNKEEEEEDK